MSEAAIDKQQEGEVKLEKHLSKKSSLSMLLSSTSAAAEEFTYDMDQEILYDDFDQTHAADHFQKSRAGQNSTNETVPFSCKDFIRAIYENELCKKAHNEENLFGNRTCADSPTLSAFGLLAAEEDGSPMDDLPEFSAATDVLAMGIEDFILIDKKTSTHLMHVRIAKPPPGSPPCAGGGKYKMSNGSTVEVMHYSSMSGVANADTSLGFEDPDLDSDHIHSPNSDSPFSGGDSSGCTSPTSPTAYGRTLCSRQSSMESMGGHDAPDVIQMFRTQSEDEEQLLKYGGGGGGGCSPKPSVAATQEHSPLGIITNRDSGDAIHTMRDDWRQKLTIQPVKNFPMSPESSPRSPRARSSSGNLTISCRRPGSERWTVPKTVSMTSATNTGKGGKNRARAVSSNTALRSNNYKQPPTPNKRIPIAIPENSTAVGATGAAGANGFNAPNNKKTYYVDTMTNGVVDPFKQFLAADQQLRTTPGHGRKHSDSLPEMDLNSVLVSLNPHTSSSKMVLTPTASTSRPPSAMSNHSSSSSRRDRSDAGGGGGGGGGGGIVRQTTPPLHNLKSSSTSSAKLAPSGGSTKAGGAPPTSSRELAAFFDGKFGQSVDDYSDSDTDDEEMSGQSGARGLNKSSKITPADSDGGGGGGGDAFSFMDASYTVSTPIRHSSNVAALLGGKQSSMRSLGIAGSLSDSDSEDSGGESVFMHQHRESKLSTAAAVGTVETAESLAALRNQTPPLRPQQPQQQPQQKQHEEVTACCSSGSDYSASDFEALHAVHVNVHAAIMNKKGSGSGSTHSMTSIKDAFSGDGSKARVPSPSPTKASTPLSPTKTDSSNNDDSSSRSRTSSEITRRPSLFERFFGSSPAGKGRKTVEIVDDRTTAATMMPSRAGSGHSILSLQAAKRVSNTSVNSANSNNNSRTAAQTVEEEGPEDDDELECSYVKDLDTGDVIELDADGDGKVTAVLISPDLIYGNGSSSSRSRANSNMSATSRKSRSGSGFWG